MTIFDDYPEGKTLTRHIAKTIEGWYVKIEHKRRLPITVFDDFWKGVYFYCCAGYRSSIRPPLPSLFLITHPLLYWMNNQLTEITGGTASISPALSLKRRPFTNIQNIYVLFSEALYLYRASIYFIAKDTLPLYIGKA